MVCKVGFLQSLLELAVWEPCSILLAFSTLSIGAGYSTWRRWLVGELERGG